MEKPKEIAMARLDVVVMPNGEVICLGKTVGWFEELKGCLSEHPSAEDDDEKLV